MVNQANEMALGRGVISTPGYLLVPPETKTALVDPDSPPLEEALA